MERYSGHGTVRAILWVLAVLLPGFIIFAAVRFRTRSVEVMGSSHYSAEEIIDMTLKGPASYNTLLAPMFLGEDSPEGIPYVEGIRVARVGAHSLRITVREQKAIGCIAYLDSYIYFDRNGAMVEGSRTRDPSFPYFSGIRPEKVEQGFRLTVDKSAALDAACTLASVFQKAEPLPDDITFDDNSRAALHYGEIEVVLGDAVLLEDKVLRALAILPELDGKKGTLHAESVTENNKRLTFDQILTYEDWMGGYESDGTYTGEGEYDAQGYYVGPPPKGILIPSVFAMTGEGSDEPLIGGQKRRTEEEKKEGDDTAASRDGTDDTRDSTGDGQEQSSQSETESGTSDQSSGLSSSTPDYTAILDPNGDGINDYTGELMSETNLQDISYLDEDGDGLNDFTLEPLNLGGSGQGTGSSAGQSGGADTASSDTASGGSEGSDMDSSSGNSGGSDSDSSSDSAGESSSVGSSGESDGSYYDSQDLSYLDEDGDGLNDFTLEPM